MNLMMLFCLYMTFVYMPFDLFLKPVASDEEVWFGLLLRGWAAKATEPLHWAIYAAGAWGFWHMRSWMWPWAAVYVAQIAVGMLVWSALDERSAGWWMGIPPLAAFGALAWLLWRSRPLFQPSR
jgi:hypothetical protein